MKALIQISMVMLLLLSQVVAGEDLVGAVDPEPLQLTMGAGAQAAESEVDVRGTNSPQEGGYMRRCAPEHGMLVPHDQTRVAILGYHKLTANGAVTEMQIRTSVFREQMEQIRVSGCTVISMQEFLEWRFGSRELPEKCVLITLDDGWRSVYTEAFPILKEYGFPFTLFLYPTFIAEGTAGLTVKMVREMQQYGATVGCHSLTHPYPSEWKAQAAGGEKALQAFMDRQMGVSRDRLMKLFGPITTYCYPGGYNTPAMLERLPSYGYVAAFTVIPGKVTDDEPALQIHRYMILGTDPNIFRNAMDFRAAQLGKMVSTGSAPGTLPPTTPPPPFPVSPLPKSVVSHDVPEIAAYLSGVSGVDFSTVRMSVSGFGRVPAKVDAENRTISWTPPCRIYMPNISVHVTWNTVDGTSLKAEWSFQVEQASTVQH